MHLQARWGSCQWHSATPQSQGRSQLLHWWSHLGRHCSGWRPLPPNVYNIMPQYHQIIRSCYCNWLNMCSYQYIPKIVLQCSSNLVFQGACYRNLNEVCHQFPIFTWKHTQNLDPRHHLGCDPEWKQSRGGSFTLKLIRVLLDTSLTDRLHRETQCNWAMWIPYSYWYAAIERQSGVWSRYIWVKVCFNYNCTL